MSKESQSRSEQGQRNYSSWKACSQKLRQRSSHCLCSICAPRRGQLKDRNQAGGSHRIVAGPKRIEINVSIVVSDARKETFNLEQWLLDSTDPGGTLLTRLSE